MKRTSLILVGLLATAVSFTGCRGIETAYSRNTLSETGTIKETKKDGTVIETTLPKGTVMEKTTRKSDESLLTDQVLATSGSVQALRIKPITSDSDSPTAEVILGGANHAGTKSPTDNNQPMYAYSRSSSIFGSITSASAAGVSFVYIGVKGESAADTATRIESLKKLAEDSASNSDTSSQTATATSTTNSSTPASPAATTTTK